MLRLCKNCWAKLLKKNHIFNLSFPYVDTHIYQTNVLWFLVVKILVMLILARFLDGETTSKITIVLKNIISVVFCMTLFVFWSQTVVRMKIKCDLSWNGVCFEKIMKRLLLINPCFIQDYFRKEVTNFK